MRNRLTTSLLCVGVLFAPSYAHAVKVINQSIIGGSVDLYEHSVVGLNTRIINATIRINSSLMLNNSGVINAPVNICSGCVLYFQNNGRFSGSFNFDDGAKLVQVISRPEEFGNLLTDRIDGLMIHNANKVSMTDIANLGKGDLVFSNSSIILDTSDLSFISNLDLRGDVLVYVDDNFEVSSEPLFENVSGSGALHIVSDISEDLMGFKTYVFEDKLYVRWERETDYLKILRNETGRFLNNLRSSNADDRLLRALDSAPNKSALRDIMSKSVRLNPVKLMTVPRLVDRLETTLFTGYDFETQTGPFFITNSDFNVYGIRGGLGGEVSENLLIGVAAYAGIGEYRDSINEYSFMTYGANLRTRYNMDNKYFVRGLFGLSKGEFDIGPVKGKRGTTETNPDGINVYGSLDAGADFRIGENWKVSPFGGIVASRATVAHDVDNDFSTRVGIGASYGFETAGIRYNYDLYASAYSSLDFDVGFAVNFLSIFDKMGGGVSLSFIRDEVVGLSYKVSLGMKIEF